MVSLHFSFLQWFILLITIFFFQFLLFDYLLSQTSKESSNNFSSNRQPFIANNYNTIKISNNLPSNDQQLIIHYLEDKNAILASQIKDFIYNKKLKHWQKLIHSQSNNKTTDYSKYEPQPKPFKTYVSDVKLLLPLPLMTDMFHIFSNEYATKTSLQKLASKLKDWKMCHFLMNSNFQSFTNISSITNNKHFTSNVNLFFQSHQKISSNFNQFLSKFHSFTIATYNLWNTNLYAFERMIEIGHILSTFHTDIICFQESRFIFHPITKQKIMQHEIILDEMEHGKWNVIKGKLNVENMDEYLIIATQYEIIHWKKYNLKYGRILLFAQLLISKNVVIDVYHTHLGLNANEQCFNIQEIWSIMSDNFNGLQIILGDFNTYLDFEYPMDILLNMDGQLLLYLLKKCGLTMDDMKRSNGFKDVWQEMYGSSIDVVRTFTNFEDYRIEDFTRTDRILFRNIIRNDTRYSLKEKSVFERKKYEWKVCDVYIVGSEPFFVHREGSHKSEMGKEQIFPSDHRGVVAKMYLNLL